MVEQKLTGLRGSGFYRLYVVSEYLLSPMYSEASCPEREHLLAASVQASSD
jgi:hypothetical protein